MSFRYERRQPETALGAGPLRLDAGTLQRASEIIETVRGQGEPALRRIAQELGDWREGQPWFYDRAALQASLRSADAERVALLERVAARIRSFAEAQRSALTEVEHPMPGGVAGHRVQPVERAGCYAPGGRYPLPSSVLMTAVTARVAGVKDVIVASPRPAEVTLQAAAVAGADGLLAIGGAQAIAAMAFGVGCAPTDVIVGPGNRYVTAAKQLVSGTVGIDMLAGPSELLVVADATCSAERVAADLLAQAEHDPDARPLLVVLDEATLRSVEAELERQLADLPTAEIARQALAAGFAVVCTDWEQALGVSDALAPEHLALHGREVEQRWQDFRNYGGLFVGDAAGEVLGDYGSGPNHVLPTGGGGRFRGGLSVFDFLRVQTWMRIDEEAAADGLYEDSAALARLEGLEAHARGADVRRSRP